MTSIPGIDELTHEGLDFDTITMEDFDESVPCDVRKKRCKSHHNEPATWIGSHVGAQSGCTILLCEPCVVYIQGWIAHCCVHHGLNGFACAICGRSYMNYKEIITRKL
jgi:hypothetical protein